MERVREREKENKDGERDIEMNEKPKNCFERDCKASGRQFLRP